MSDNGYLSTIKTDLEQMVAGLETLSNRRQTLQAEIDHLDAEGCVNGNIVTEWRNGNGPYYRLTFYTDPITGVKPKPVYIGANLDWLERVKQQIINHQKRLELRQEVLGINKVFESVEDNIKRLTRLLSYHNRPKMQQQQLVIPAALAGGGDNTKNGGNCGN